MADVGELKIRLVFDSKGMKASQNQAEASIKTAGIKMSKGWAAAMGVISGITSQVFSKVTNVISSSLDSAISRVDTMNNFPKVMQSLGYSADSASDSVQTMSDHLDGLPTTLNDMVSNVQMLSATMGNLNDGTVNATSVGLAFNDMMLAGGQGTDAANRALTQYNQMLATGKVDMQSWNSVVQAAPGQMNQLAQSLLGAEANSQRLYEALKDGTVSFDDLNSAMVRLDTEGGDAFASFSEQAIAGTQGIATNLQNLQTSVSKVIAAAINGDDISKPLDQLIKRFDSFAKQLIPVVGRIAEAVIQALPPILESIATAIVDYLPTFIQSLANMLPSFITSLVNMASQIVMALANNLSSILNSLVNGIIAALMALTKPENLQKLLMAGLTLLLELVKAIPQVIIALVQALPDIIMNIVDFLTNPDNIMMIISASVQLFMGLVQAVPQILGALFQAFTQLFGRLWERLTTIFGEFAASFGETIGNIFKNAINGVISFIENFLNVPIRAINGLVDLVNNLPGVDLGKIPEFSLPRLAQGGYADGATPAIFGEAGKEAVLPLERNTDNWSGLLARTLADEFEHQELGAGGGVTIEHMDFNIDNELDARDIGRVMMQSIRRSA